MGRAASSARLAADAHQRYNPFRRPAREGSPGRGGGRSGSPLSFFAGSRPMRTLTAAWLLLVPCMVPTRADTLDALLDALAASGADAAAAVGRGVDAVEPAGRELLEAALAGWVEHARDDARRRGTAPVPPALRAELAGHVPDEVLDRAGFRIDDTMLSVQQALFVLGDTPALTVDDVILFRDTEAASDPVLWAHEIHHVVQYRAWGVDGFVTRYLAGRGEIEHAANEFTWRWLKATGRVPAAAAAR